MGEHKECMYKTMCQGPNNCPMRTTIDNQASVGGDNMDGNTYGPVWMKNEWLRFVASIIAHVADCPYNQQNSIKNLLKTHTIQKQRANHLK